MTIGARVREERVRRGLSHDRLAAALGTTRQVVIRWERGVRPNTESRRKLAAYFGDEEFLGESQPRRAFHSVVIQNGEDHRAYVPERVVWRSESLAVQVREQARRELVAWTNRYEQYAELADMVGPVREALAA
jgi:transcriptional regulator with XRE-family HTH domain